jgi:hypothetical protein
MSPSRCHIIIVLETLFREERRGEILYYYPREAHCLISPPHLVLFFRLPEPDSRSQLDIPDAIFHNI